MSTQRSDQSPIFSSGSATSRVPEGILGSGPQHPLSITPNSVIVLDGLAYEVLRLIASSGEAEVFLMNKDGQQWVLKYYFSNYKPKDEVILRLKKMTRTDIMVPVATGTYNDRFYEVIEYMTGGTIDVLMPVRDPELIKIYLRQIVEAMNACHEAGVIHRDIKPVNLFFKTANRTQIVLGDFGIASPLQAGTDYRFTTNVNRTNAYAAPELFTNINNQTTLDKKVDYYALGISLLELFLGGDPFKNYPEFMAMRLKIEGRIQLPEDLSPAFKTLLKGLLTTEPPKRWGYEEVIKWLNGEPVKVYESSAGSKFASYEWDRMNGIVLDNPIEMADHMEKDRQRAERQLYSRSIPDWTKSTSPDLYSELLHIIEREYPNSSPENTQAGITKAIYTLDRERPFTVFDGQRCNSTKELAEHIEANTAYYLQELRKPYAGLYLFLETRGFQDRVKVYRRYFLDYTPEKALNLVVLDLQDHKFYLGNQVFENVSVLMAAGKPITDRVFSLAANPDSKLSLWIDIQFSNLSDGIQKWQRDLAHQSLDTLSYALQTGGFKMAGEEVKDAAGFYELFKKRIQLFTLSPKAPGYRKEADYWLRNYQHSSLNSVISGYLDNESSSFEDFKVLFGGLLEQSNLNPLTVLKSHVPAVAAQTHKNPAQLQVLVAQTSAAWLTYVAATIPDFVFALEAVSTALKPLVELHDQLPEFCEQLVAALDGTFQQYIDRDQQKMAGNSATYNSYRKNLQTFMEKYPGPFNPGSACLRHWETEEKVIRSRTSYIEQKYKEKGQKEAKKIDAEFVQYAKDQFNRTIPYNTFFRSYLSIFVLVFGLTVAYFIFLWQAALNEMPKTASSVVAAIFAGAALLLSLFLRPGKTAFPQRSSLGEFLYRPVMKALEKSPNQQIFGATAQKKQDELRKAAVKNDGGKTNEIFEESVKIALMEDTQLRALTY